MTRAPIATARDTCRRGPAALPAWCLALLFATVQLSNVAHMLVVRHVRCAEHGAWEHAQAHGVSALAGEHHGVHGAQTPERAQVLAADADGEHGHDACPATAERRDAAVVAHAPALEAVADTAAPVIAPRVPRYAARDVLSRAPKTSPPV